MQGEQQNILGAVLKPIETVCADSMWALIIGYMHIQTGWRHIVAVSSLSKASNMLTPYWLAAFAMDPVYNRPLKQNPYFIAGMEMNRYLYETGVTKEQCALVSVKNKGNALLNPAAAHGEKITVDDVLKLRGDILSFKSIRYKFVSRWLYSYGAGFRGPGKGFELQHMEALNLCSKGESGKFIAEGVTQRDGDLPINVSGGCLGVGRLAQLTGLQKVLEVVLQLRGEAGKRQVPGKPRRGLAQAWGERSSMTQWHAWPNLFAR